MWSGLYSDPDIEPPVSHLNDLGLDVDNHGNRQLHPAKDPMKLYKDGTYSVAGLVEDIGKGKVALPDIQRPFVWSGAQVRNLFDSMYRGYPVGYLLFWETGAAAGARRIDGDADQETPANLIIDGQQRTTALYAVMTAREVMRKDYTSARITIAFRPTDGTFEVGNAAVNKNPEFLPDISRLFDRDVSAGSVKREYLRRLRVHREVTDEESDRIEDAIERVRDLAKYEFRVVYLSASADIEEISEIFVRINSAGAELNKSDFLLTLMSVFWEKGRKDLESFCEASRMPARNGRPSPFNWHLHPKPVQLLRAAVALAFRRARLDSVYALLRGRDMEGGQSRLDRINEQFATLSDAQSKVLNLVHWHEFLQCLELAGFRGKKMITSDTAVVYSYVMWLIGRIEHRVPLDRLRHLIARWFFMSHTTSRYSGSFETQVERDLVAVAKVDSPDAYGKVLSRIIDDTFTGDYWAVTLPNALASSASKSPVLSGYIAALNILDADTLLSRTKVRNRLDPAITVKKGIERHHLFPKAYLQGKLKISDLRMVNQIANMALVEWSDNIAISDRAPAEYWPQQVGANGVPAEVLDRQMKWHALPLNWTEMSYEDFLPARRTMMARVVRQAFERLATDGYRADYPEPAETEVLPVFVPESQTSLADLLDAGLVAPKDILVNIEYETEALVLEDGRVEYDNEVYDSVSAAAVAATGGKANGLAYWSAEVPEEGTRTLQQLAAAASERWRDVRPEFMTDPATELLAARLRDADCPAPQFGVDQVDGWEAELAWPSRRVAVLNGTDSQAAHRRAAFERAGWTAKFASEWSVAELTQLLRP